MTKHLVTLLFPLETVLFFFESLQDGGGYCKAMVRTGRGKQRLSEIQNSGFFHDQQCIIFQVSTQNNTFL